MTSLAYLSAADAESLFGDMLDGNMDDATIRHWLVSLYQRGETADEIAGAARAMQARMRPLATPVATMDVCGTGGDGHATRNISTATAFVLAALEIPIAKHGNRAVSSASGSTDVLAALGLALSDDANILNECLAKNHFCYIPAPSFHPALSRLMPIRKSLAHRTIFNLLGPLCNPARPAMQLLGVYDATLAPIIARAAQQLGAANLCISHGLIGGAANGLDELSVCGDSLLWWISPEGIREERLSLATTGLPTYPLAALQGGDAADNAAAMMAIFSGEQNAYVDAVCLNAAAALRLAGKCDGWVEGIAMAHAALSDGRALHCLQRAVQLSKTMVL